MNFLLWRVNDCLEGSGDCNFDRHWVEVAFHAMYDLIAKHSLEQWIIWVGEYFSDWSLMS